MKTSTAAKALCVLGILTASPALAATPFDSTAYCSGLKACLGSAPSWCTPNQLKKNPEIKYDGNFCDEYTVLSQRGISVEDPAAKQMWMSLGMRYRVEYEASGVLPIRNESMRYLINNLPFATELVNAYSKTNYSVRMSDGNKAFEGDNGRNLSGKFRYLYRDTTSQNVLWGQGIASVLAWKLVGDAVVFLDYQPMDSTHVGWQLRLVAFPANSTVNSIMGTRFFRNKVVEELREIIGDVNKSANEFAKGNRAPLANSKELADAESQVWLKEFEATTVAK